MRLRPTVTALEGRTLLSTIVVDNPTDEPVTGQIDLRQAIDQANSDGGGDTIQFDSTVFNTPRTITLTGGQLELSGTTAPTTITGPGANLLSVSGKQASRVFQIDRGVTASISGLTITGGKYIFSVFNPYFSGGGGLYNAGGTVTLTDCIVSGNSAEIGFGGGLFNSAGTVTLIDCTVSGNSASSSGGLFNNGGTVTLTDCTVSGNSAYSSSGLFNNGGTVTLTDCTVSHNSARNGAGGGLTNTGGTATLTDCTVSGNSASSGGGLFNNGGTATLTDCTVRDNSAGIGGGLQNTNGTVTLTDCTVGDNFGGFGGGGLQNTNGTVTLTDCSVSGNFSGFGGGGLTNVGGTATLTDCTVSGNSASTNGGGLLNFRARATLTDCTVSGNSASSSGGGLFNYGGTATLTNTIVAGNGGGDAWGDYLGSNNLIGGDPLLAPLGDYGGPTQTMALLPGSPAIGTGNPALAVDPTTNQPLTADQRGYTPGSMADIGAFQDQGFTLTPVTGGTPQAAVVGTTFANPLAVTVTAHNTGPFTNPVDGGVIGFTVNPAAGGASANLSAGAATITAGQASITAAANTVAGSYNVTASAASVSNPASFSLTNDPAPATQLVVDGFPSPVTAGTQAAVTVTAEDQFGNVDSSGPNAFNGTVTFTSSDGQAALPGPAALSNGSGSFNITLKTAGLQSITATSGGLTASQSNISVNPTAANHFVVTTSPTSASVGAEVRVTVTAYDPYNNVATGYTGAVHLTSTDPKAILPADYTFGTDHGAHAFVVIFQTTGNQTVTATDTAQKTITATSAPISVTAATAIQHGQSAGIGFWNGPNGQALIDCSNGGPGSTALANWLAASFPNLYGASAGSDNLTNKTNAQVAAFYQQLFGLSGPKLDAQVLATALDVYATTSSLGGTAGAAYGFVVAAAGLGGSACNVRSGGSAFGVPNSSTLTVLTILEEADAQAVQGVLYNGKTTLRKQAVTVFDGINSAGGL
jgi:hypothetical protein